MGITIDLGVLGMTRTHTYVGVSACERRDPKPLAGDQKKRWMIRGDSAKPTHSTKPSFMWPLIINLYLSYDHFQHVATTKQAILVPRCIMTQTISRSHINMHCSGHCQVLYANLEFVKTIQQYNPNRMIPKIMWVCSAYLWCQPWTKSNPTILHNSVWCSENVKPARNGCFSN